MRIFVGIDLDLEVRARIERFLEGVEGFAPEARWVRPESLHITLKFIGEQPSERVEAVSERLRRVEIGAFEIRAGGYGFFPTAKAPRVFWIGIHAGLQLAELAESIDMATSELGIPREDRPYSPHLTLARAGAVSRSGSPKWRKGDGPNATFAVLETRLAAMGELDVGTMTAREFILYQSQLSPAGSTYTKLQRFALNSN
jgi:RNA 2',3'-cyclic 3'-phosphodiesterase